MSRTGINDDGEDVYAGSDGKFTYEDDQEDLHEGEEGIMPS